MTEIVIQQVVNWLVFASIYALIAVGFTLLFGVVDIVHFSHGDVSILGAFIALSLLSAAAAAFPAADPALLATAAVILAIALTGVIGLALERGLVRPFRNAPALMVLVSTVAIGIVIREGIRIVFPEGSNPKAFPAPMREPIVSLPGLELNGYTLFVLVSSLVILGALYWLLRHTNIGVRIRAVAQDYEAAMLMGVNVNRSMAATFFAASAIGAMAALMFASYVGILRFDFGLILGLKGFAAAVVGGLGSVFGAIIGGLLLAGIETAAMATVDGGTAYKEVFSFLLVIMFLVFRPVGILGKPMSEKV